MTAATSAPAFPVWTLLRYAGLAAALLATLLGIAWGYAALTSPRPDETLSYRYSEAGLEAEFAVEIAVDITVECFYPAAQRDDGLRRPALVMLHGVDGPHYNLGDYHALARSYADHGYVVYFVHYFDAHPYSNLLLLTSENKLDLKAIEAHMVQDKERWNAVVAAALRWAAGQPRVDGKRVGVVGYSLGCYVAVGATETSIARDDVPDVGALVGNWGGAYADQTFSATLPPARFFHGREDEYVPVADVRKLVAALRSAGIDASLTDYPGQRHILVGEAADDAFARAVEFLDSRLAK
jgi:dienelactone hydrolase